MSRVTDLKIPAVDNNNMNHYDESRGPQQDPAQAGWEPCAPGSLTSLATDLKQRRERRKWLRTGTVLGTAMILLAGALVFNGLGGAAELGCREVLSMLARYDEGQLSATVEKQVSEHLDRCPHCREQYEQLQDQNQTSRGPAPPLLANAVNAR